MSFLSNFLRPLISLRPGEHLHLDMHAHWLPGIDDGAKTPEDTLALVNGLYDLGYRHLIATPHIYPEFYPNTPATIAAAYASVEPLLRERFPDLTIGYAAEYFLDESFQALVDQKALLPITGNKVLVEFSFFAQPPQAEETFFQMQLKGYRPILAHVERYPYLFGHDKKLDRFRDMGVELQGNLLSLSGRYGPEVQKQALHLLRHGYYAWLGTDCHHAEHIAQLRDFRLSKADAKILEGQGFNRV